MKNHDKGCACLPNKGEKCNCEQGKWRHMKQRAANHFKRAKVTITLVSLGFEWISRDGWMVGTRAKIPFGKGKIGRVR